jgi:peptidoglycan/LPS O-acetylase OafA/YrhL
MKKEIDQLSRTKVYFPLLDVLRGPAALLVFAEHWRNLFFVDFKDLENPSAITKMFYLLTGTGHEAVMIFFVLSGCVIAHVIQNMRDRSTWSWKSYSSARLTRLWVVLIPSLLLTAMWDFFGMSYTSFSNSIYEGSGFGHVLNSPVAENSNVICFLGNALFLQTILVPTFGSNGPLWSIAFEFVYYLAYPALLLGCFSKRSVPYRFASILFGVALLTLCGRPIANAFPIWMAGAICYSIFRRWPASSKIALWGFLAGCVVTFMSVIASRIPQYSAGLNSEMLIAVCTAFTLYFGLSVETSKRSVFWLRPFQGLSAISYSLYLLHMPVLVFISSRYFSAESIRWLPDAAHLSFAATIGVVVLLYCIVVWYFTEKQTQLFRKWLQS